MSFLSRGKAFANNAVSKAATSVSAAKNNANTAVSSAKSTAARVRSNASNVVSQKAPLLAEVAEDAKSAACSAASTAKTSTSHAVSRASNVAASLSGSKTSSLAGPMPRIIYAAVSRNDDILAEALAKDSPTSSPDEVAIDNASASALGQKMMRRKAPPGWDELSSGLLRCIRLPVHDAYGVTCYTITFTNSLPGDRAQAFVQKLALMLEPMIEKTAGPAANLQKMRASVFPVLERELLNSNTGLKQYQIENQINETRAIMMENVERMLDRQQRLEDLEGKSNSLGQATQAFNNGSRRLRRYHLMNQVKWGVAIGTGVTVGTAAICVPIIVALA